MAHRPTVQVNLCPNGDYWQGWWIINGERGTRGLGPIKGRGQPKGRKPPMSRRQALKRCQEISNELSANPAVAGKAPRLGEFIAGYVKGRTDLKASTRYLYGLAGRYLVGHFGHGRRIDDITRAQARDWRAALQAGSIKLPPMKVEQATVGGKRQKGRANGAMAETTACNGCKYAKAIFRQAVDDDLILYNPFDKLRSSAPDPEKDWHDVSIEDLDKLTAACESDGWKCLIALCRLAGLRRSEALALRWGDIDWERRMLLGVGGKTRTTVKRKSYKRDVPVEPKLYDVLLDCFGRAVPGEELVCAVNGDNLRRDFAVIRKRAGLPFWKKPFHTLRKNRETEWASDYPIHAVAEWLGHDVEVLAKHYAKVTTDLCERVTGKRQQGEAQQQPAAHATAVTTEAPQVPQGKAS